jgi:hypothetical protein
VDGPASRLIRLDVACEGSGAVSDFIAIGERKSDSQLSYSRPWASKYGTKW